MTYNHDYFVREIKAIRKEVDNQDFERANILSNRITSNALILNAEIYAIVGFLVKDLIFMVQQIRRVNDNTLISSISSLIKLFIDEILKLDFSNSENDPTLWKKYHQKLVSVRIHIIDDKDTYSNENPEITTRGMINLISFVEKNLDLLDKPFNSIFATFLTEINRLYSEYSISLKDSKIRIAIILLYMIDEYGRRFQLDSLMMKKYIENEVISPYTELIKIIKKDNFDKEMDLFISKLILVWRQLYLKLGEPENKSKIQENQMNLDPDLKNKLTDLVSNSIEEYVKRTK